MEDGGGCSRDRFDVQEKDTSSATRNPPNPRIRSQASPTPSWKMCRSHSPVPAASLPIEDRRGGVDLKHRAVGSVADRDLATHSVPSDANALHRDRAERQLRVFRGVEEVRRAQVGVAFGNTGIDTGGRDERFDGLQLSVLLVSIVPRTRVMWPSKWRCPHSGLRIPPGCGLCQWSTSLADNSHSKFGLDRAFPALELPWSDVSLFKQVPEPIG
jgi:hypothetical protein